MKGDFNPAFQNGKTDSKTFPPKGGRLGCRLGESRDLMCPLPQIWSFQADMAVVVVCAALKPSSITSLPGGLGDPHPRGEMGRGWPLESPPPKESQGGSSSLDPQRQSVAHRQRRAEPQPRFRNAGKLTHVETQKKNKCQGGGEGEAQPASGPREAPDPLQGWDLAEERTSQAHLQTCLSFAQSSLGGTIHGYHLV